MNSLYGYIGEAYTTWLRSSINCCFPLQEQAPGSRSENEKHMRIEYHEPRLVPSPIPELDERRSRSREWVSRSRSFAARASSRGSFTVRRNLHAYNGFTRPRIGAPSGFRHLNESSVPRRTSRFRPLELSIYLPQNQLSPILPHFNLDDAPMLDDMHDLQRPPTAMTHSRSDSALSFRIPRKPIRSDSRASSEWTAQFQARPEALLARTDVPSPPPPARLRANTEPGSGPTYERIKSALHEKYELEQRLRDIDEVIEERKSIYSMYIASRPTSRATSHLMSLTSTVPEPMPTPPPLKPSFAERVVPDQRPKTAPSKPTVHIPARLTSFTAASAAFSANSSSSSSSYRESIPPPPLPLMLTSPRPPLRKKKSFSRVSVWLSRSGSTATSQHSRSMSIDSITNTPKQLKDREGFYQCVDMRIIGEARSSISSVSTLEDTWTLESSPGRKTETRETTVELERTRTFGALSSQGNVLEAIAKEDWRMKSPGKVYVPEPSNVGVAF